MERAIKSDLRAAVKLACAKAGGAPALASALNIKPQAIYQWREVPAKRLVAVEQASGVPREQLRPDLFVRRVVAA